METKELKRFFMGSCVSANERNWGQVPKSRDKNIKERCTCSDKNPF